MKYRIDIKRKFGTIGLEAETVSDFKEGLTHLSDIIEAASATLEEDVSIEAVGEYPNIGKPQSQSDAVIKLLSTDWGKKIPRTLSELHSALAHNTVHMTKEVLGSLLTKMKKAGKLTRIKRDRVYAYSLPLSSA